MNRLRLILLGAALLAALIAAYVATSLLKREPAPPSQPIVINKTETVDVLVAAKNVIEGEQLGNFAVEWRPWPTDSVAEGMITKEAMPDAVEQMQQARARLPLIAGEPIVPGKIVRPGERGFMSAILPQGMRAVAVPIGESTAVSGFVLPNDRVDVIFTHESSDRSGEKSSTSQTVLSNVKVLAINQTLRAGEDGATVPGGRNAVLELDPLQSEILTKLTAEGTLTLVLRSLGEGGPGGLADVKPQLASDYLNPHRTLNGPLVIRYGLERSVPNR